MCIRDSTTAITIVPVITWWWRERSWWRWWWWWLCWCWWLWLWWYPLVSKTNRTRSYLLHTHIHRFFGSSQRVLVPFASRPSSGRDDRFPPSDPWASGRSLPPHRFQPRRVVLVLHFQEWLCARPSLIIAFSDPKMNVFGSVFFFFCLIL